MPGWHQGDIYCLVCIQLAFGMWIPRMLWVGKVGLKVGLKQPSSATGPSPFGSTGPSAGQVKTKAWMNFQVGLYVLHHRAKSTLLYHNNNGQVEFVEPV